MSFARLLTSETRVAFLSLSESTALLELALLCLAADL